MAKNIRRILSVCMVLCVLIGVLPLQALAAEDGTTTEVVDGVVITTTQTTEVTTDGDKTTVTVTVGKTSAGTEDSTGKKVTGSETTITSTTTDAEGNEVGSKWSVDGYEKKEWTEEDTGDEAGQPEVSVTLEPGKSHSGTATETTTEGDTTTTVTDRTVTTETSEIKTTVNESNSGNVEDQEIKLEGLTPVYDVIDGVKQDKGGMFDNQFNSGLNNKYADPAKWTGANAMPEDADLRFLGTGEHTTYYASLVYVVYEKDENGNAIKDENGEYVIKELWRYDPKSYTPAQITKDGEPVTELPDDISGLPQYDVNPGGNRPTLHVLMDQYGNTVYGYCIDNMQATTAGAWYKISNLEDSDYYASEDAENHVRNIVKNGYWGTTNIADENGEYATGSVEKIKQNLKQAIKDGKLSDELVLPEYNEDGTPKLDESGNPVYKTWSMTEVIEGLTAGEANIATQAAIWSYSNGSIAAQNGLDGYLIIDPDHPSNHKKGNSKPDADILDDFGGARIDLLYTWLIGLEEEEESTIIINDKNFVEDMSLTVGDKVADHAANKDDDQNNDVYNTSLNFKLAFIPGENDDLLVQISYIDMDGNPVNIIRRLAGENAEGQNYEAITPEADGSYVLKGLQLSENKDWGFDLRLEGTQYLEQGVYVYEAVGGRTASQNFVGLAEGERNVDVSMGVTIKFDVDENNHVVAERKWHDESDPVEEPTTPDEEEEEEVVEEEEVTPPENYRVVINDDGLEEIPDEPVPLASAPKTGDNSGLWILLVMVAAFGIVALNIFTKKRNTTSI